MRRAGIRGLTSPARRVVVLLAVALLANANPQFALAQPNLDRLGDPLPAGAVARLGSSRLQHPGGALVAEFAPDGERLVTLGRDGAVNVCEAATGRTLSRLTAGATNLSRIRQTDKGLVCATAGPGPLVKVWDLAAGRVLMEFAALDSLKSLALSPDGKLLAGGANTNKIFLWNTGSGRLDREINAHAGWVTAVAFSPDAKQLASGGQDHLACLWDVASGKLVHRLAGHGEWVWGIDFAPDGKTVATASWDNTIGVWDANTGKLTRSLKGHTSRVWSVAFSPDGRSVVSGGDDNTMRLWNFASGVQQLKLPHRWWANGVSFSPDSTRIASAGEDGLIRVFAANNGQELLLRAGHHARVTSLAFSADGRQLASGGGDNSAIRWDIVTSRPTEMITEAAAVNAVALSPNGTTLALGTADGTLLAWSKGAQQTVSLKGHTDAVLSVTFLSNGVIASTSADRTVRLWDAAKGRSVDEWNGHTGWVTAIAADPQGELLATGSQDDSVRIWKLDGAAEPQPTVLRTPHWVTSLAFSSRGELAAGGLDERVRIWGIEDPKPRHTLDWKQTETNSVVQADVYGVAFSPRGNLLAAVGEDKVVRLWDPASGKLLRTLAGHLGPINAVAFAPDGQTLATGSDDGTLLIWKVAEEQ